MTRSKVAFFLLFVSVCLGYSCKKWKDPASVSDPRLTNPYCNDPSAVNYNLGFPGKPDNTVCFYPSDIFEGVYEMKDSVYLAESGLYITADSLIIHIYKYSNSKIAVEGLCNTGVRIYMTAGPTYSAVIDTLVGDSTTLNHGQMLCRSLDTISGVISRDRVDTTLLHIDLKIVSDTGTTVRIGTARRK